MRRGLMLNFDYCLTPNTRLNNATIVIRDGTIVAVGGRSAFTQLHADYEVIEMPGCYATPGLIDTRIYGAANFDCVSAHRTDRQGSQATIADMSRMLAAYGVTSFLPTTQSHRHDELLKAVSAMADACEAEQPGAVPVGIHIEGPFINPEKHGAHNVAYIRPIDLDEVRQLIAAGRGHVRIFTFAPELEHAVELVELLKANHIVPCLGHTMATEYEVRRAIDAGATRCSHLYNGMPPLLNRQMSLAGMALNDPEMWVEFIPDGIHCHDGMIDLACRAKRKDRLIAISNSMEAAGMPSGVYRLGPDKIRVAHGRAIVVADEGAARTPGGRGQSPKAAPVLAGSIRFLGEDYRRIMRHNRFHLNDHEATACVTINPARSIGLADRGQIKPGKRADLTVFDADPKKRRVQMTIVNGRIVYRRDPRESGRDQTETDDPREATPAATASV